jgi:hypothetical protein
MGDRTGENRAPLAFPEWGSFRAIGFADAQDIKKEVGICIVSIIQNFQ